VKDIIKVISITIASFAVIIALLLGVRIYQTYKTEANAFDILKAVIKLELSKKNIIKVNEGMYLTKSDTKVIKEILKSKGWQFEEQMGAGYVFTSGTEEALVLTTRQVVSSRYLIWQGRNIDKLLSPVTGAIIDFYKNTSEPIIIYEQIPFEEGMLVLAEMVMDGEHYPDTHFICHRISELLSFV
jgi:hypothetical protein